VTIKNMQKALTATMRYAYFPVMPMTSEEIKTARLSLQESQEAFGARFGVDQSTVHRWETKGLPDRGAARIAVESLLVSLRQQNEASQ
jgi:DNA-binding transcriptional regulator YiaG